MEALAIVYQAEITLLLLYTLLMRSGGKNAVRKYFLVYLLITNAVEILSLLGNTYLDFSTNGIIYNGYSLFCLCFFYLLYVRSFSGICRSVFSGLFGLASACTVVYTDLFKFEYDYRTGAVLCLFYILSALLWMGYRLLNADNRKITAHPEFWISVGLIVWSSFFILRSVPMYLFERTDTGFQNILRRIFYLVNMVFYGLFFIALRQSEKQTYENKQPAL